MKPSAKPKTDLRDESGQFAMLVNSGPAESQFYRIAHARGSAHQFQRIIAAVRVMLEADCRNWLYVDGRYTLEPLPLE